MAITPLPTLDRTSSTFRTDVDTFFGSLLPTFSTQVNSVVAEVNEATAGVDQKVTAAQNAASTAQGAAAAAGAVMWTAGTYAVSDVRYSPSNFQTYRRKTDGASTVDPASDVANWASLTAGEVTLSGNETLRNKRISAFFYLDKTATNAAATGAIDLDVSLASVFAMTLSGDVTLSIINAPVLSSETQAFVVRVTQGSTARNLTWWSGITWLTIGGVAPAAPAANKTTEYIFTTTAAGTYIGRKGAAT